MINEKQIIEEPEEGDSEFQAVSDLMSFLAGLFILFTIVNSRNQKSRIFSKVNVRFSDKQVEHQMTEDERLVKDIQDYIREGD